MRTPEYEAQRLQHQLARDDRVSELGIDVTIVEGKVFLRGKVSTLQRRDAIEAIAHETLPNYSVVNEVTVVEPQRPALENLP